ncbi:unnamed protein product [Pleuronectes platessa]|uniref:Uncharacterized protein n=1 Tax=Pleuronectes platessa TaxID=8262 RepID=A0A9N7ZB39_PLEPL|nr:unnamed protein product [Pleuronectes platessa]
MSSPSQCSECDCAMSTPRCHDYELRLMQQTAQREAPRCPSSVRLLRGAISRLVGQCSFSVQQCSCATVSPRPSPTSSPASPRSAVSLLWDVCQRGAGFIAITLVGPGGHEVKPVVDSEAEELVGLRELRATISRRDGGPALCSSCGGPVWPVAAVPHFPGAAGSGARLPRNSFCRLRPPHPLSPKELDTDEDMKEEGPPWCLYVIQRRRGNDSSLSPTQGRQRRSTADFPCYSAFFSPSPSEM